MASRLPSLPIYIYFLKFDSTFLQNNFRVYLSFRTYLFNKFKVMIILGTLVSCMLAMSYATIVKRPSFNITVTHEDVHQFNLTQMFYMAGAKNPKCEVKASPAHYFNWSTAIASKDISSYHYADEPEIVNMVTNHSIYAIYDESSVVIQEINLDHQSFGTFVENQFGTPGADTYCTDLELNQPNNRLYVACMTRVNSTAETKLMWLIELDATTGKEVSRVSIEQDDDHKVLHRLQVKIIAGVDAAQRLMKYVIVHDQGIQSAYSTSNRWVWVLNGVDSTLHTLGYVDFPQDGTFKVQYDIFPYRDGFLVTGKDNALNDTIKINFCQLRYPRGVLAVNCSDTKMDTPYNTTYGYVGVLNNGQFIEINTNPNQTSDEFYVCDFSGEWNTSNFIDLDSCKTYTSFKTFDNVSISNAEGNAFQIVVKYCHDDSTYAGYSLHNFDLRIEDNHYDDSLAPHLVPLGKTLVRVTRNNIDILRMVPDYIIINATELVSGINNIRIDCTDDDTTTPVTYMLYVTKMDNMKSEVRAVADRVPEFSVYEDSMFMFQVDPHMVYGNDLKFTVDFETNATNFTQAQVYDTERINVAFTMERGSTKFHDIHFAGRHAVAHDTHGQIIFMNCMFTGIAAVHCHERAIIPYSGQNVQLMKDLNKVFDWLFAWSVNGDTNITNVYLFNGYDDVITFPINGVADDVMMSSWDGYAYIAASFSQRGIIQGWRISQLNFKFWEPVPSILTKDTRLEFFCPTDIDFDPDDEDILEVLSVCPGKDQRIVRFLYPPVVEQKTGKLKVNIVSQVPINFAYQNPQICSMGHEFIVYSQLGKSVDLTSYSHYNDRNRWKFGTLTDELNLGTFTDFNCIPRTGIFTTESRDQNQNKILTIYWGNQQYQANHKVYNTLRSGLNSYKHINSYELWGQVIHTLDNLDGSFDYLLTFTKGQVVQVVVRHGLGNTTVKMNLKFTNGGSGRDQITKNVEIVKPYTEFKVANIKKINDSPSGVVNIEEYAQFQGPLLDAHLADGTHGARLLGRVTSHASWVPHEPEATIDMLETYGTITVGVHTSRTNDSIFTIFQDIDNFVGHYQPAHGVNAFHLAPFANTDNDSFIIAYSTAEPTNNSLQFVALNGSHRMGVGYVNDNRTHNFTKIRVVPLTQGNSWLVFGYNYDSIALHVFRVSFNNGQFTSQELDTVWNVHDFTYTFTNSSTQIYVFHVLNTARNLVEYSAYDRGTGQFQFTKKANLEELEDMMEPYEITSLECDYHNATHFYLLVNTAGTKIYEFVMSSNNPGVPTTYIYFKVPHTMGRYMHGNHRHFIIMTADPRLEEGVRYMVYHRQLAGGSPHVYWSVHNDIPRPFTITTCPHNMSHFQMATFNHYIPLKFLTIQPMQLNITNSNGWEDFGIVFHSNPLTQDTELSLKEIFNGGGSDDKKSSSWWPFVLLIAVLVLCAVGFIAWKGIKDKQSRSDEAENYVSLKPEARESGKPSEDDA